jgi:hypothetical protein
MLPSEILDGTATECAHLRLLLACFRADPPPMRLPHVTGCPLYDLLGTGVIDEDVFRVGYSVMATRYQELGIRRLLPLERVWVGTHSAAGLGSARGFGGFHHPSQGYRHVQMDAAVTVFGDLTGHQPKPPRLAAIDLVRSYAHDCLHYATFRRYRLSDRGEIARVQYGINLRQPDGRTYSAPDATGDGPTRNLGILMEAATDAEATSIARQAADDCGITLKDRAGLSGLALADATGTLHAGAVEQALASTQPYARSLGRFNVTVTGRYRTLLRELATDPGELHGLFVAAMIAGDKTGLEKWLDARHGTNCFDRLFRVPSFDEPVR